MLSMLISNFCFLNEIEAKDIALRQIFMGEFYPPGEHNLNFFVGNAGQGTIYSFTLSWRINGGPMQSEIIEDIAATASVSFHEINSQTSFTVSNEIENHLLEVWVDSPNGELDDDPSNNFMSHSFQGISNSTDNNVLMEVMSGAWCAYCSDGDVIADEILAAFPDQLNRVSFHNGDAMEIDNISNELESAFSAGVPNAIINRSLYPVEYLGQNIEDLSYERENWHRKVALAAKLYAPVHISSSNSYNSASRQLNVNIEATFLANMDGDFRINCYIIENPVVGQGDGFDQSNAYSFNENTPDHPYYNYPNPITNYAHPDVIRNMLGGPWGSIAGIPSAVQPGESYNLQFNHTLEEGLIAENCYLMIVIQKYHESVLERSILNSLKCSFNSETSMNLFNYNEIQSCNVQARVFLEGPYLQDGTMATDLMDILPAAQPFNTSPYFYAGSELINQLPNNVVDWILLEMRTGEPAESGEPGTTIVEQKAGLLLSNGSIVSVNGDDGINFHNLDPQEEYYIAVRHRNHLDVLSSNSVECIGNSIIYDFTTGIVQSFGTNQMKLSDNEYSMLFGGDFTKDGIIQVSDQDFWKLNPALLNQYHQADGNMDGQVQLTDFDLWYFNKAKLGISEFR